MRMLKSHYKLNKALLIKKLLKALLLAQDVH